MKIEAAVDAATAPIPDVSGALVSVIGLGTVFLALAVVVAMLTLVPKFFDWMERDKSEDGSPSPSNGAAAGEATDAPSGSEQTTDLLIVALAAYGLHQSRRVTVRTPTMPTRWAIAGRSQEVLRFEKRS